jgi:endonuclease/exonuclease/phosphatase family metal-dependent hydrolase
MLTRFYAILLLGLAAFSAQRFLPLAGAIPVDLFCLLSLLGLVAEHVKTKSLGTAPVKKHHPVSSKVPAKVPTPTPQQQVKKSGSRPKKQDTMPALNSRVVPFQKPSPEVPKKKRAQQLSGQRKRGKEKETRLVQRVNSAHVDLTILSLNVESSKHGHHALPRILEIVEEQHVDVLLLQEVPGQRFLNELHRQLSQLDPAWRSKLARNSGQDNLAMCWKERGKQFYCCQLTNVEMLAKPEDQQRSRPLFLGDFVLPNGDTVQIGTVHLQRRARNLRLEQERFLADAAVFGDENKDGEIIGDHVEYNDGYRTLREAITETHHEAPLPLKPTHCGSHQSILDGGLVPLHWHVSGELVTQCHTSWPDHRAVLFTIDTNPIEEWLEMAA